MPGFDMSDYVPVNERVEAFIAKHPDGSLQSEIVELTESRVTVKAYAYRSPDDQRPGTGHSSLEIPGRTPYTKGSEIENAETSAWGRAIAALGFEVKRGLASAEEVRNKQPEPGERGSGGKGAAPATTPAPVQPHGELRDRIFAAAQAAGIDRDGLERISDQVGVPKGERATEHQLLAILKVIEDRQADHIAEVTGGEVEPNESAGAPAEPVVEPAAAAEQEDGSPSGPPATAIPPKTAEAIERARAKGRKPAEQVGAGLE